MKAFAIAVSAGLLAAAPATPSKRTDVTMVAATTTASVTDFSARRKRRAAAPGVPGKVVAAPLAAAQPGWTGADPSKGPGIAQLRELQREGRCVIDEGYGRYSGCSSD
jgi:hypothetical protein